jgi:hypothetical protein
MRANAATARSNSLPTRALIGLTSIPNDGAVLDRAHKPSLLYGGVAKDRRSRDVWRDLFEHPGNFTDAVFGQRETGGVAARARQTINVACANG